MVMNLTDPGYLAILAKAEDLFVEGTTEDPSIYMMQNRPHRRGGCACPA
jgi:hypothetical protein